MRAYRARAQFRGESALGTWLIQIAVNLVRDRIRSRRLQFWRSAATRSVEVGEAARWLSDHGPRRKRRRVRINRWLKSAKQWSTFPSASGRFSCCVLSRVWTWWRSPAPRNERRHGEDAPLSRFERGTAAGRSNAMNRHLTEQQILECVAGTAVADSLRHVEECAVCAAESIAWKARLADSQRRCVGRRLLPRRAWIGRRRGSHGCRCGACRGGAGAAAARHSHHVSRQFLSESH